MFTDRLAGFYAELRWDGWEQEVAELEPHQGIHVYPPLVMRSEGPRSHRAVPMEELWHSGIELGRKIAGLPDGTPVQIVVTE